MSPNSDKNDGILPATTYARVITGSDHMESKEACMQGEFYGNDDWSHGSDVYASGNSHASAFGPQENSEIRESQPLDVNNSNSKLDKYLFYFSSRL